MRTPLLVAALLLLTAVPALADDPGVMHRNDLSTPQLSAVAAGTTSLSDVMLTYRYMNQWGLMETWQIQGTTLYVWKSIHTAEFHDMARAKLAGGGSLSAVDSQIFELPYGNQEIYQKATLSPAQVRSLIGALATDRFTDAPARVGCGEKHWEIALDIAGARTHVFDVNAAGNDILAACIDEVQDLLKAVDGQLVAINKSEWDANYVDLVSDTGLDA